MTVLPRDLIAKLRGATSFRGLLSACATHQANFNENHISVVWYKIDKLPKPTTWKHSVVVSGLQDTTFRLLLWSGPRTVATIAHSAAKAKYTSPRLFDTLANLSQKLLDGFNAQGLANIAWAFATVDQRAPQLFEAAAEKAKECWEDFNAQELANIVWAFATVDQRSPQLFEAVSEKAERRLDEFNPQNLANIVWAFAAVHQRAPELFEAVADKAQERLEEFEPQGLANIAWAFATLEPAAASELIIAVMAESAKLFQTLGEVDTGLLCLGFELEQCAHLLAIDLSAALHEIVEKAFLEALFVLRCLVVVARASCCLSKLESFEMVSMGSMRTKHLLDASGVAASSVMPDHSSKSDHGAQVRCALEYNLFIHIVEDVARSRVNVKEFGSSFFSGAPQEAHIKASGISELQTITLSFSRRKDAEFLALASAVRTVRHAQLSRMNSHVAWKVHGFMRIGISKAPCLNCASVIAQFKHLFPEVHVRVTFVAGTAATPDHLGELH